MPKIGNRARMATASTGTGTITLGAAQAGFQSFAAAGVATGDQVRYVIEEGTAWEIGLGTYTAAGTTLTRTLLESSTGALLVLGGAAVVYLSVAAQDLPDLVNIQEFATPGAATWTKPVNGSPRLVHVVIHGGGGGGGSGRLRADSTTAAGGGGGGGAGGRTEAWIPATLLGATVALTIGAGGAAGTAIVTTANGNSGGTAATPCSAPIARGAASAAMAARRRAAAAAMRAVRPKACRATARPIWRTAVQAWRQRWARPAHGAACGRAAAAARRALRRRRRR